MADVFIGCGGLDIYRHTETSDWLEFYIVFHGEGGFYIGGENAYILEKRLESLNNLFPRSLD